MPRPPAKLVGLGAAAAAAGAAALAARRARRSGSLPHPAGRTAPASQRVAALARLSATRATDIVASAMGWRDADDAEQALVVDLTGELADVAHRHARPSSFAPSRHAGARHGPRRPASRSYVSSR